MMLRVWILAVVLSAMVFLSAELNEEFKFLTILTILKVSLRQLNGEIEKPTKLSDLKGPYWWNDSHVGATLECDEDAKYCLDAGRVLYEPTGQCYELGDDRPCGSDERLLGLDEEAFNQGKLRSVCLNINICTLPELPMGTDVTCHDLEDILTNLCPFTQSFAFHPFGGLQCIYPQELYSDPVRVVQPRTLGRCILPSLRSKFFGPFVVQCSTEEAFCLENGKLPFKNSCYTALSTVPCAERQWLVLDDREAKEGRLRVSCRSAHPCGPGEHLLHVDGTCHSEQDMRDWLCPDEHIMYHVNGDAFCERDDEMPLIHGIELEDGKCQILFD